MVANQKRLGLTTITRLLTVACLVLLVATVSISYLSFINFTEIQTSQNTLEAKYQDLILDYANLQKNFSSLQANLTQLQRNYVTNQSFSELLQTSSFIQAQLTDLESQFSSSESRQNLLNLQHELFKSQLHSLQANYTGFLSAYQLLGTASPFSYLVFCDANGTYYAQNGTTQTLDFSGRSGDQVAQKCIETLSGTGGKIVFAGRIKLDAPIIISPDSTNGLLELSGFGPSTQLISGYGIDCINIIGTNAFGYEGPYHVSINNFVLTSETSPEGRYMNNGIYVKNWFNINIENVMVFYANNAGIRIEDSANVHLNNLYVEGCAGTEYGGAKPLTGKGFWLSGSKDVYLSQCYSDTNEIGFLFDSNSQSDTFSRNVFLTQCEATYNEKQGVTLANTHGIVFTSTLVEGTNGDGVMVIDSSQANIMDSIVIGNVGNGIVVTTESANNSQAQIAIKDCTVVGNGKNGIGIWAKNSMQISQVRIESCTITNSGTGVRGNQNQPEIWDGINISNDSYFGGKCFSINVQNCLIGNDAESLPTQKYGVRSLQNSEFVSLIGNRFFGNLAGDFALAGQQNTTIDNSAG